MQIKRQTLSMTRGDNASFDIVMRLGDTIKDFEEGDTVYFTVKKDLDSEKELQKVITTFDEGKAVVEVLPKDTKEMVFGKYTYDIQLTDKHGVVTTIIKPNVFILEGEVTDE